MPKLIALCQQQTNPDGSIGPNYGGLPINGFVQTDPGSGNNNWAAYIFSGTGAQLAAINALPSVVGVCVVTEAGDVKWAELDSTIGAAARTKLNTWLTNHGYANVPAGWTNKQTILTLFRRLNPDFDFDRFDVAEQ
jgi:hypothetical protein